MCRRAAQAAQLALVLPIHIRAWFKCIPTASFALEMNQKPKLPRNEHTRTRKKEKRSLAETESRGPERGAAGKDETAQRHHLHHLVLDRHLPRGPVAVP
jgi:hypothetical protein